VANRFFPNINEKCRRDKDRLHRYYVGYRAAHAPDARHGLNFLQGETEYIQLIHTHSQALKQQGAQFVVVLSELAFIKTSI